MSIDLKSIGEEIAKIGLPLLGAALPIPGGAALGVALAAKIGSPSSNPADILSTLQGDPKAVEAAREFEMTHEETILRLTTQHEVDMRKQDSADIATVNATMQAEAANSDKEVWYQKAWRPANGFSIALSSFVSVVFICILFYRALSGSGPNVAQVIAIIPQLATAIATILAVPGAAVGIASWWRGKQKVAAQKSVPRGAA